MLGSHPVALREAENSGTAFRVVANQRFRISVPGGSGGYDLNIAYSTKVKVQGPA